MKHTLKAQYPAPSDLVIRMFTDKDFHTRKLDGMGLQKYEVLDHRFDGKDFSIRIERKVPVNMPGAKGAESTVVNEESWNVASKSGRVQVEAKGIPLDMSCTMSMADEGEGCVVTYEWNVKSSLPIVGGTLEKFAVADMDKRSAQETEAGVAQLSHYR